MVEANDLKNDRLKALVEDSASQLEPLEELAIRVLGSLWMRQCGVLLKLPVVTIHTAIAAVHRFLESNPVEEFSFKEIGEAAFLAVGKSEESQRRIADIIQVSDFLSSRGETLEIDTKSTYFKTRRAKLVYYESLLLVSLGFSTQLVGYPHKRLIYICHTLGLSQPDFLQTAWEYLSDSYCLPIANFFEPHEIAFAAIFLSSQLAEIGLPAECHAAFEVDPERSSRIARLILDLQSFPRSSLAQS